MSRKLIFIDIDGTLTEPGQNVPPASALEAIRRARANGHAVYLCTGRNLEMLSPLLEYGWDGYIASSGGHIMAGDKVIYDCPMTPPQQEKVLTVLQEAGIYRTVETLDGAYTDEGFKDFLRAHADEEGNSELLRWREQVEKSLSIRPMKEYEGQPCYKVVIMIPHADCLKEPQRFLEEEFQIVIQEGNQAGFLNGEVLNRAFNKGTAVKLTAQHLGISIADTIGFGDSMNDLEMIETVGTSICMDNGAQALKQLADDVCPAVDEDGLYKAFEKYGLI